MSKWAFNWFIIIVSVLIRSTDLRREKFTNFNSLEWIISHRFRQTSYDGYWKTEKNGGKRVSSTWLCTSKNSCQIDSIRLKWMNQKCKFFICLKTRNKIWRIWATRWSSTGIWVHINENFAYFFPLRLCWKMRTLKIESLHLRFGLTTTGMSAQHMMPCIRYKRSNVLARTERFTKLVSEMLMHQIKSIGL